tara:strand:+ start:210 stop:1295 length:1086 start_codon:yes stop_codon:yes gene_type:complete
MKIKLFFFVPSLEYGGASNAVINFIRFLDKNKFDLNLFYQGKNKYAKYLPKYVNLYKLNRNKTFLNFFIIKKILKEKIKKNNKNIFISNIHFANILSIIFLRKIPNLKILLFERTSLKELDLSPSGNNFKNKIIKLLISKLYSYSDLVLTNSKNTSKELKNISINSKIVYSGLINKILPKKKIKKKSFYKLIAVGRLEAQKDYFTLIKAIKIVKNNNFKLFIYGEGSEKLKILNFINTNNLKNKVVMMGHENNKNKIYSNADLLIVSSIFEGLPNCVVEAINYNVPIIASNIGGNKEILNNSKFGDIFETKNEKSLASKITGFLKKPKNLYKKVNLDKNLIKKFLIQNSTKNLEKKIINLF